MTPTGRETRGTGLLSLVGLLVMCCDAAGIGGWVGAEWGASAPSRTARSPSRPRRQASLPLLDDLRHEAALAVAGTAVSTGPTSVSTVLAR